MNTAPCPAARRPGRAFVVGAGIAGVAAALAVEGLLGAPHRLPPTYQGVDHRNAPIGAFRR